MRYKPLVAALFALAPASLSAADLLEVYRLALEGDPQLRGEQAAFEAVGETKRQARALFLPQINAGANISRERQEIESSSSAFITPSTTYFTTKGYSLNLSQTIYHGDYYARLHQADAATRQAEAGLRAQEQDLIVRAVSRYLDVLAAQDSLGFARAEREAIQRQLEQTKQRFDVGLIAITDVHEAQAAHDLAVAQEIAADNALAAARESLREVTGKTFEQLNAPREDMAFASPDPADVEQWIATALKQNFPLIAAQANVEAAQEGVKRERAGHYPTLDAVAGYSYTDIGGGTFGGRESNDATIGLQLNVPLYQGGAVASRSREAAHRLTQAREGLEQQRRVTERQTRDAYLAVNAGISRVAALKQATVSGQSALDATQAGLDVGTRTMVDVLQAQRDLYRARRDYARARYDYVIQSLQLKQAAGTLGGTDVEAVNKWFTASSVEVKN